MSPARPTRRAWTAVALVAALPVTLLPAALDGETGTWWPAGALVAAALLLLPRRRRGWVLLAAVAVLTPSVALVYDIAWWVALPAAVLVPVTALLVDLGLRPPPGDHDPRSREPARIRDFAGARYHVVVGLASLLAGLLAALVVLPTDGPVVAGGWALTSFLGALTGFLLVLPLVATPAVEPARGGRTELWLQRAAMTAITATLFFASVPAALATAGFPLLGWAAHRASRSEAHLQVLAFGTAAYVATALKIGRAPDELPGALTGGLSPQLALVPAYLFLTSVGLFIVPLALAAERLTRARAAAVRDAATVQRLLDGAGRTLLLAADSSGKILHANEGARQLLGYPSEQILGIQAQCFFSEEEVRRQSTALGVHPDLATCMAEQARRGERRDWEFTRSDGEVRSVSLALNLTTQEDGRPMVVASGEDVTDRLRTQHALETALDREHRSVLRLREVDHVKQELVSNVSHELRTPITSIAGYAELLSDSSLGELTRSQRDALERIERNAQRLETLVDDLLTMSRAEAGRLQLARATVDLAEVARSAWDLFGEQLRLRQLDTALVLPPDPVPVVGDAGALERIVVNLVSNAIKFTADGGSVVLALSRRQDGTARLVVRDTGIGITAEDQAELFTRFFRSQEATDKAIQGTGLGLSIVQALVAQHGGRVDVRSRPGEGTRVTVELPAP